MWVARGIRKTEDDIVVLLKFKKNTQTKAYNVEKHLVSISQMLKEIGQGVMRINSKYEKVL